MRLFIKIQLASGYKTASIILINNTSEPSIELVLNIATMKEAMKANVFFLNIILTIKTSITQTIGGQLAHLLHQF